MDLCAEQSIEKIFEIIWKNSYAGKGPDTVDVLIQKPLKKKSMPDSNNQFRIQKKFNPQDLESLNDN